MTSDMKICIVSDCHDRSDSMAAAILAAKACGVQAVIHCGDLIGVNTLRASLDVGIPIHAVHGNNVGDIDALYRMMKKTGGMFTYHGQEAVVGHRRICLRSRRGDDRHAVPVMPGQRGNLPVGNQQETGHKVRHASGVLLAADDGGLRRQREAGRTGRAYYSAEKIA